MPPAKRQPHVIDLDAARAARDEAEETGPVFKLGGEQYTLPARLPVKVLVSFARIQRGDMAAFAEALEALFGDQLDDLLDAGFELEDLMAVIGGYGMGVGEAEASDSSS